MNDYCAICGGEKAHDPRSICMMCQEKLEPPPEWEPESEDE